MGLQKKERKRKKGTMEKKKQVRQEAGVAVCFLRGIGIAFAITCIIFIGYGILLTYTELSEESLPMVSLICTALSAAAAGYDWAVCKGQKGLLWGGVAGIVYGLLLYLITALAADSFVVELSGWMTWIVAAAAGAVGGILGVNGK